MVIDSRDYRIPRRSIMTSQRTAEIKRERRAFARAIQELDELESAKRCEES